MTKMRYFAQRSAPLRLRPAAEKLRKPAFLIIAAVAALSIASCSGSKSSKSLFAGKGSPKLNSSGPIPKGGGRRHVGKPYEINGGKYYPKDVSSYEKTGVASWYGPKFHRRMTSNGEWFDMHDLTGAHKTLPLPSYVKVTNLANGKQAVLRINDRGPFAHDRIIDLSKRSSEILDFKGRGTAKVRVVYLGKAPLAHDGTHLAAMNRKYLSQENFNRVASAMNYSRSGTMLADARVNQPVQAMASPQPVEAGQYFVQAASFSSPDNARRAKVSLSEIGPVDISPVAVGERTLYRVSVGPLDSAASAEQAKYEILGKGMPGARVIER